MANKQDNQQDKKSTKATCGKKATAGKKQNGAGFDAQCSDSDSNHSSAVKNWFKGNNQPGWLQQ